MNDLPDNWSVVAQSYFPVPKASKEHVAVHFLFTRWHLCSIFGRGKDVWLSKTSTYRVKLYHVLLQHQQVDLEKEKQREEQRAGSVVMLCSLTEWLNEGHLDCSVLSCVIVA